MALTWSQLPISEACASLYSEFARSSKSPGAPPNIVHSQTRLFSLTDVALDFSGFLETPCSRRRRISVCRYDRHRWADQTGEEHDEQDPGVLLRPREKLSVYWYHPYIGECIGSWCFPPLGRLPSSLYHHPTQPKSKTLPY